MPKDMMRQAAASCLRTVSGLQIRRRTSAERWTALGALRPC